MKNVFISHVHEDDEDLGKLKALLSKHGYPVRDASITSEKPNKATNEEYIKAKILRPGINWAGTLIVYVSERTKHSKWVNWEIEEANRLGKNVVGVWAHGSSAADAPQALLDCADAVEVGWNGKSIIDAIEGKSTSWVRPDGSPSDKQEIKRISCA